MLISMLSKTAKRLFARSSTTSCLLFLFYITVPAQAIVAQHTKASAVTLINPVMDIDFPDPTVINVQGIFYAYATQAAYNGKMINIQVASSADMVTWKYMGDALPQKPGWANHTQDFWAPHVLYDSTIKKFVMFFCAESNDTATDKCIGVAFSNAPAGPFIDKGSPLLAGKGFADIDPMAMTDPQTGKKILYWGSDFQPIKAQELNNDWSSFKEGSRAVAIEYPGREKNYTNLIEGAWVDYYAGKYYLYYSGDNCCGSKANYAVMIARADSALGPFIRLGEVNGNGSSVILEKDSTWLAPGHNSIFKDNNNNTYIAFHAIWQDKQRAGELSGKDKSLKRVMCIEHVKYINGWPVVSL